MALDIAIDPLLPLWLLAAFALVAVAVALAGLRSGNRGGVLRLLLAGLVIGAILNPQVVQETRSPRGDVVLAVIDRSASNRLAERSAQTDAAREALERHASREGYELRVVETDPEATETRLFSRLSDALAELPAERLSAILLLSDGLVHDAAASGGAARAAEVPVHALLSGRPDLPDRRLTLHRAPEYGLVDSPVTFELEVTDSPAGASGSAELRIVHPDGREERRTVPTGDRIELTVTPERRGQHFLDVSVSAIENERLLVNNRRLMSFQAVRDRLRVLLVSGEPHAGERIWRDTLKADPAVDLIHFTILRLPDSQDPTPVAQLSLIPFPTERLFNDQLDDFDLVIFDRYSLRGVLEMRYFDNLVDYVEAGGAVLLANGPEYAGDNSLFLTPLGSLLPAMPQGAPQARPYRPALTDAGQRHPVTAGLPGDPEAWGRWFRILGSDLRSGTVLMTGPEEQSLLVLDSRGEGRIAQLMSDHVWLWARGVDGGGPHQELLRRTVHWLMKEPDLEETALTARFDGPRLVVERRGPTTEGASAGITLPDGAEDSIDLRRIEPGLSRGEMISEALGLYRVESGDLSTVVARGPLDGRELAEVIPEAGRLRPLVESTGGGLFWLHEAMPDIRRVDAGQRSAGRGWLGLPRRNASRVEALTTEPLLPAWAWALMIAALMMLVWRREAR